MTTKPLLLALLVLAVAGCGERDRRVVDLRDYPHTFDGKYYKFDVGVHVWQGDYLILPLPDTSMQSRISRLAADSARCAEGNVITARENMTINSVGYLRDLVTGETLLFPCKVIKGRDYEIVWPAIRDTTRKGE